MNRLCNYIPLHMLVLGVMGICCQYFFSFIDDKSLCIIVSVFCFLIISTLIIKNKIVHTLFIFGLYFLVGASSVFIHNPQNSSSFYKYHHQKKALLTLKIRKRLKSGTFHQKYEATISYVNGVKTHGTVLLNLEKDSVNTFFKIDDILLLQPVLKEIAPPLNPHQFNYKAYLAKKEIHHQLFVKRNEVLKVQTSKKTVLGWSSRFRDRVRKQLIKYHFKGDVLAVIEALLLGQRQDISKSLITDYQKAGVIHILAVSGLHIGILLLIVSFLLQPLEQLYHGVLLKTVLIILILWVFAVVAGLSASVVRAATMFTFVAIGMSFKQPKVIEFSFTASMLLLLIIHPMFLFDVGFQLSYLAVFGILTMQAKIYAIWQPKFKISNFFWKLCSVSLAAQIGILPLSIYYFKQFPGLFLLSNFVIIPFLGTVLVLGIGVVILSLLNILPSFIANFYSYIISKMNAFVGWVSRQEAFLFKELSLSFMMMAFWYLFIFIGISFLIKRTYVKSVLLLVAVVLLQTTLILEKKKFQTKKEFVVFHKSRYGMIGERLGAKLTINHSLDSLSFQKQKIIPSYKVAEQIKTIQIARKKSVFKFLEQPVLLVDSLGIYKVDGLQSAHVILQYSPKINLSRLIKKIKPSVIVADGSNYKSYVTHWGKICKKNKVPFYYTGKKGAYILK